MERERERSARPSSYSILPGFEAPGEVTASASSLHINPAKVDQGQGPWRPGETSSRGSLSTIATPRDAVRAPDARLEETQEPFVLLGADHLDITPAEEPGGLVRGAKAKVIGLNSQVELNGTEVELIDFKKDKDRWRIKLGDGTVKLLREGNLSPLVEDSTLAEGG